MTPKRPKNLKISKSTKLGPISNIGPKTSRAARDRPELNPRKQTSRHDIAGTSPDGGRRRQQISRRASLHKSAHVAAQPRASSGLSAGQQVASGLRIPCAGVGHHASTNSSTACAKCRPSIAPPAVLHVRGRRPAHGRYAHPVHMKSRGMRAIVHGSLCRSMRRRPTGVSQLPCWRLGAWLRPVSRGNRHFTVGGGRLRQSGPRPEGRLLRQPALEGLTRSAQTDSPRKFGRNKFRRGAAAAAAEAILGRGEGRRPKLRS
ncbi:thylakoid lumenal 15.0 kDa protein 2, chloroplastic [Dorcoceras hygrometricum]|uniref:Thylakoid lumenal 15.0 kDa protein 2, chloroplastic n=1 Tax=Dorcoceras hygrometricum TaxID=472368 RepID=A0A2Z7BTW5_9LAMI|nr:thylakoid lumenal 15.0 kDa protein 2, chloroplastic [Dorcoceras hygrometricum]